MHAFSDLLVVHGVALEDDHAVIADALCGTSTALCTWSNMGCRACWTLQVLRISRDSMQKLEKDKDRPSEGLRVPLLQSMHGWRPCIVIEAVHSRPSSCTMIEAMHRGPDRRESIKHLGL